MKKSILLSLFILCTLTILDAQVTSVSYLIEFNDATSLYDCKLVIDEGEAMAYPDRIQFNSQYTVVVPTGAQVSLEERHNPLENNQFYEGTTPCLWEVSQVLISPEIQPENDFHAFFPNLTLPSAYNNLAEGDTITLFSLNIDVDHCTNAVRPFANDGDLQNGFPGDGGDYSCGFTFGGGTQVYNGNLSTEVQNTIADSDTILLCEGECIEFTANLPCIDADSILYEWSTGDSTAMIEVCPDIPTNYYLLVKDSMDNVLDSLSVYVDVFNIELELSDSMICEFGTATISANVGGTWSTTNPNVATVNAFSGEITAISWGAVIIEFTGTNGCSALSDILFITENPIVVAPDVMCLGGTTTLSPTVGGIWESSDPTVASITNNATLEALTPGNVELTFSDTSTNCFTIVELEVIEAQTVVNTGSDTLCVGETTILTPSQGGFWTLSFSTSNNVATINNDGLVTSIGEGKAVFSFISNAPGCGAINSDTLIVLNSPDVQLLGDNELCIGEITSIPLNPNTTYEINNPNFISYEDSTGTIIGLSQGTATITLVDTITGCSKTTDTFIVYDPPSVLSEASEICVGDSTELLSSSIGSWIALDSSIATVDSFVVQGISEGEARFLFTDSGTECISDTLTITVLPKPEVALSGPNPICVGETTNLSPATGGTWNTNNSSSITIDNLGNVTGFMEGFGIATYTNATTQCSTTLEDTIFVLPLPFETILPTSVCVGESLSISITDLMGTWESSNPEVVSVDSISGNLMTISPGTTNIIFTSNDTGCSNFFEINVSEVQQTMFLADSVICIGNTSAVAPSSGIWSSENTEVATITSNGIITAVGSGSATLVYVDPITGCAGQPLTVVVLEESDPACIVNVNDTDASDILIYPNPARNFVVIESQIPIEAMTLFSTDFSKVREEEFNQDQYELQWNTQNLPSGLYILGIKSKGKIHYQKLIIK